MSIKTKRQQKMAVWKLKAFNKYLPIEVMFCGVYLRYQSTMIKCVIIFGTAFLWQKYSFWPAKLSFQSDFADSQQLSRPPLLIVNFCINISQCNWHMITMNAIIFPINTFFVYNTLKILTSPKKINTCSKSTIETQVQGEKHR